MSGTPRQLRPRISDLSLSARRVEPKAAALEQRWHRLIYLPHGDSGTPVAEVLFAYDDARIVNAEKLLADTRALLKTAPRRRNVQLTVSGHADRLGGRFYNRGLAARRAVSVANMLIKEGFRVNETWSYGETCPRVVDRVRSRDLPDGRALNRRAVVSLTSPSGPGDAQRCLDPAASQVTKVGP